MTRPDQPRGCHAKGPSLRSGGKRHERRRRVPPLAASRRSFRRVEFRSPELVPSEPAHEFRSTANDTDEELHVRASKRSFGWQAGLKLNLPRNFKRQVERLFGGLTADQGSLFFAHTLNEVLQFELERFFLRER